MTVELAPLDSIIGQRRAVSALQFGLGMREFESEHYVAQRDELGKQLDQRRNTLLSELRAKAREFGVAVQMTPYGVMTLPLPNGEPIPEQAFDRLIQTQKDELKQHNEDFQEHVRAMMKQGRAIEREAQEQWAALDKQVTQYVVGGSMDD